MKNLLFSTMFFIIVSHDISERLQNVVLGLDISLVVLVSFPKMSKHSHRSYCSKHNTTPRFLNKRLLGGKPISVEHYMSYEACIFA